MLSPKLDDFERSEYLPELQDVGWELVPERDALKKTYQSRISEKLLVGCPAYPFGRKK